MAMLNRRSNLFYPLQRQARQDQIVPGVHRLYFDRETPEALIRLRARGFEKCINVDRFACAWIGSIAWASTALDTAAEI